jgi:FKBP-type peptidyl-prolyl cis-trans isomerase
MKPNYILLIITSLLLIVGCNQAAKKEEPIKTEEPAKVMLNTPEQKRSYALGMMIAERIVKQYGEVDPEFLLHGLTAHQQDTGPLITLTDAEQILTEYQKQQADTQFAAVKAKGEEFLKANALVEGVMATESGLQYQVLTATDGAKPAETDTVSVHYRGTLMDGTEFDSSYARGEPATFALNQVIPGWTEGVQLMTVGSKYKFVIPYHLGYGERGAGQSIGPFETLTFEVELIEIK